MSSTTTTTTTATTTTMKRSYRHHHNATAFFLVCILLCSGVSLADAFLTKSSPIASSTWSSGRFRQDVLFSSRPPRQQRRYYEDDEDDDYYDRPRRSTRGQSKEEMELRNMPREDIMMYDDEKSNDDDDDLQDVAKRPSSANRNKMQRYKSRYENEPRYEDDDYDDDYYEDDDEDEPPAGNFWSNPSRTTDPVSRRPRPRNGVYEKRRDRDRYDYDDDPPKYRRRSKISSGGPEPPAVVKDFYEQLFWYGFDPDDSDYVGDKTVFGGTKGKFNGLSYLAASEDGKAPNRNRLPPPRRSSDKYYDDSFYDDDEEDDDDDDEAEISDRGEKSGVRFRVKPPSDVVYPKNDSSRDRARRRERRQRPQRRGRRDDNDGILGSFLGSDQVSSWFNDGIDDEDDYDDRDSYRSDRGRRRQNRKQNSDWSPFNALDTFFGLDRDDMKYKADLYDEKMGLRKSKRRKARRGPSRESPRRAGYAYPYKEDGNDDDEFPLVADIDTIAEVIETGSVVETPGDNGADNTKGKNEERKSRSRESSWEERALAVERVPPADIPAWGPTGELPVDARTKAIMDALDDIQVATRKLETKQKKEALAEEDVTILKVDAALERRRLEDSRRGARLANERLRQIDLDLTDAGLALRRSRLQTQMAKDQLEELQDRHWALLSFYDPNQAKEKVSEALNELQQLEPAARLDDVNIPGVSEVAPAKKPETEM